MSIDTTGPEILLLSRSWHKRESELSFVTRAVAGAASRSGIVTVITPMSPGATEADGAFDLLGIGQGPGGDWPPADEARWTRRPGTGASWILDEVTEGARALFHAFGTRSSAHSIAPAGPAGAADILHLHLAPTPTMPPSGVLGMHVPVNPLARTSRHGGLGMTGYLLVLTDRPSTPANVPPTATVAWLTSRFHNQFIVVVEGGNAAVWKGRALRGVVGVNTRTDLWRLMAHARLMVDLAPGRIIARECIESLRFGTPVVVPDGTVAGAHARAGGGVTFGDVQELLHGIEQLLNDTQRETYSQCGMHYADSLYGDAPAFVARLGRVLRARSS